MYYIYTYICIYQYLMFAAADVSFMKAETLPEFFKGIHPAPSI